MAIGPSFLNSGTARPSTEAIRRDEESRERRAWSESSTRRFQAISKAAIRYAEVATPADASSATCLKNDGAVAGPKQQLGQHMFRRQHTADEWDNLFCCGESTVLGTGTPAVTTSGHRRRERDPAKRSASSRSATIRTSPTT
ncbi:MAG: hypothetical protein M0C28_18350 [Candidatus Moduliflexus flocculans]|nr:hypothetical protein [Candidatus Moduliflexus flocculans]